MNSSRFNKVTERALSWLQRKDGVAITITRGGTAIAANIPAVEGNQTRRKELHDIGGLMADYDAVFAVLVRDAGSPAIGDRVTRVSDSRAYRVETIGESLNDGTILLNCYGVER